MGIGQPSIKVITKAAIEGKVPGDLPGIVPIKPDAVVDEPAMLETQRGLFAARPQAVAHKHQTDGIVQWIGGAIWVERVSRNPTSKGSTDFRAKSKERGKTCLINTIIFGTKLDGMAAFHKAGVILGLSILLVGILGRVRIWTKQKTTQAGDVNRRRRVRESRQSITVNDSVDE